MISNSTHLLRKKIAIRSSIRFYFYTAAILLSLFALWHYLDRESERQHWQQEEIRVVYAAASGLSSFLYEAIGDLLILADQKELFAGNASSNDRLADIFERVSTVRRGYHQVRFIDLQGKEVVRINYEDGVARRVPDSDLQNKSLRPYFVSTVGLSPGDVYVSRFDLNVERGEIERPFRPVIRFATPVYDSKGNKKGVLVINYLGEKLLRQIYMLDSQRKSRLMLLNAEGYWLYSQASPDSWGFQLPHKRNISSDYPEWESISTSSFGQFVSDQGLLTHVQVGELKADDREWLTKYTPAGGIRLFFAERPWQIVSLTSAELLYSKSISRFKYAALGLLLLLIALIPLSMTWGERRAQATDDQARIQNHVKAIEKSEEETRTLLRQNRKITRQLFKAQEEERRYIARELHDEFGQWLTAIQLDAQIIAGVISDKDSEILTCANDISESARQIHRGISGMINTLRPAMLGELGLTESLRELLSRWQSHNLDTECELSLACELCDLDESSEITIYRVVQEALNNIAKHANASHVAISIREEGSSPGAKKRLVLFIEDDGVGMDVTQLPEGMGLASMRERMVSVGGEFGIHSRVGKGTRITAALPVRQIEA